MELCYSRSIITHFTQEHGCLFSDWQNWYKTSVKVKCNKKNKSFRLSVHVLELYSQECDFLIRSVSTVLSSHCFLLGPFCQTFTKAVFLETAHSEKKDSFIVLKLHRSGKCFTFKGEVCKGC